MHQTFPILSLKSDSQVMIEQSIRRLEQFGLQVMRSFDLRLARAAHVSCTCPHHGTDQCDCQMVVLLVYGQADTPVSLLIHSHDGLTQVAIVDTPGQRPAPDLVHDIYYAILPVRELVDQPARVPPQSECHAG